jgi:N utilization substance protein B
MASRRKARVEALKVVYQLEIKRVESLSQKDNLWQDVKLKDTSLKFCKNLVKSVFENKKKIDKILSDYTQHWRLERIALIDKSILRIGISEMLFLKETPPVVIIDEAIEIAKKYSTEDSGKFVNGILDRIKKEYNLK